MIELIGIISILVGIFWMLKLTINNKPIVFLKLAEKVTSFYINQEGKYELGTDTCSVCGVLAFVHLSRKEVRPCPP